jgi:RND family efflux transporter MFP subunit
MKIPGDDIMKKMIWLFVVIILLTACSPAGLKTQEKEMNQELPVHKEIFIMAGKIETEEKADIASKITAKVLDIGVDVGSTVKKGDTLITLNSSDLEAQVAQAQAGISHAQAALGGAKAHYDNAKAVLERNQQLFTAGAVSQSQLDQFQTALTASEAALNASQSQVNQAQAALELAQTQLNNATIVSPISGSIGAKNMNPGELAVAGQPLVTVVNPDSLIINAYLPSAYLSEIKAGQQVLIKVSEVPDKVFHGEISMIGSALDAKNKNISVRVKLKEHDAALKPGMFAEISLD